MATTGYTAKREPSFTVTTTYPTEQTPYQT